MLSQPLFTFAVIADTHLNPTDDASSSPWETNEAANDRCRAVVQELNGSGVDFVVHLGDLVDPIPGHDDYGAAADRFHAILAESVALYHRHFSPDYATFEHGGATFVILDARLLNTDLPERAR
jgi:3',5'-cyclic AMP phosphodiesterase CpdA